MRLIPERKIESRIELNREEFNKMVNYKILLEDMVEGFKREDLETLAGIPVGYLEAEIDSVKMIMDRVNLVEVFG